ncbi:MAG: hypothetical protein AMJ72_02730 [Acidithiobacillales bacterium SM1_46]|nr:MAG: hypothetical protein AMJ72_02730 [Acidithiobacillales bacterium SM1_46]
MAAPNIVNTTAIYGKSTAYTPSGTSAVVLLANTSSSGKVLRVNNITAANVDGTNAVNATVSYYTDGDVAQGSAPSGGTAYPIASTISVPANASLTVMDKMTSLYLEEDRSITVTSGAANKITFTVSYEEIS